MNTQTFYVAAVALCAASFVANGGWNGDRFARVKNDAAADRLLFLAWAMFVAAIAT